MHLNRFRLVMMFSALPALLCGPAADACTRAVYFGQEGQTVTGRTMDWASDLHTNLWVLPSGLKRSSQTATPFTWTSRYGSVIASIYEGGTADGMNERGLVANLLYLAESTYPPAHAEVQPPCTL